VEALEPRRRSAALRDLLVAAIERDDAPRARHALALGAPWPDAFGSWGAKALAVGIGEEPQLPLATWRAAGVDDVRLGAGLARIDVSWNAAEPDAALRLRTRLDAVDPTRAKVVLALDPTRVHGDARSTMPDC